MLELSSRLTSLEELVLLFNNPAQQFESRQLAVLARIPTLTALTLQVGCRQSNDGRCVYAVPVASAEAQCCSGCPSPMLQQQSTSTMPVYRHCAATLLCAFTTRTGQLPP